MDLCFISASLDMIRVLSVARRTVRNKAVDKCRVDTHGCWPAFVSFGFRDSYLVFLFLLERSDRSLLGFEDSVQPPRAESTHTQPACACPYPAYIYLPDCCRSCYVLTPVFPHLLFPRRSSQTKVVVYGVLYGQSADALAPQLRLSRPEAFKIRQTVLKTFPKLTEFLKKVKEDCKKCG